MCTGLVRTSQRSARQTTELEKWRRKRTTRDGEGESSCLSKALGLGSEDEISKSRFNSLSAKLLSAALGVKPQKILLLLENRQWLILAWGRILRLNLLTLIFQMTQARQWSF